MPLNDGGLAAGQVLAVEPPDQKENPYNTSIFHGKV
jgi:hypothetical protein